jgi:hypothetical protein
MEFHPAASVDSLSGVSLPLRNVCLHFRKLQSVQFNTEPSKTHLKLKAALIKATNCSYHYFFGAGSILFPRST